MRLRLSPGSIARVLRNLGYTPGRDLRLPYTIELDPTDYPLGTTLVSATLTIATDFGETALVTKQITSVASADGQITDTGADGVGALVFAIAVTDQAAFRAFGPCAYEVTVADNLGRTASLDEGSLIPLPTMAGKPVDHVLVTPGTFTLAWPTPQQLVATAYDVDGQVLTGRSVAWSVSDPTIATVDVNGVVSAVAPGAAIITATVEGQPGQSVATVTVGVPATAQDVVAAVNSIDTARITHAWAPGYGHTLTVGRKAAIVDFVAGGLDGALSLVPSFTGGGGAGLNYDPATPDRFTYAGSSMKVVAAHDLDFSATRAFGYVGLRNADTIYFMQSHDGTGGHTWSWDFDGTYSIPPLPGGNPPTGKTTGVPTDGHVQHCILQYDAVGDGANLEIQGIVGRDARCWCGDGLAGSVAGMSGSRTLEVGNFFGGGGGNNLTGDMRLLYIVGGNATLSKAQLKILNDWAENHAGAYKDDRNYLAFSGNSIVARGVGQAAQQTRVLLGSTWIVLDLGVPGYTWTALKLRAPRVEALLDFTNRPKPICAFYEYTNTVNFTTTPDAATYATKSKQAEADVFGATTGTPRKKILVTMLPTTENYPYNSANGLSFDSTVRVPGNTLLRGDAYFDAIAGWGEDAIMGQYTTLPNTTYYADEVHPTTGVGGGTPILANLVKTAALSL